MNWLAHILLSKRDVEYQIGNFLADPLKGKAWKDASNSIKQGMLMHKAIDIYTDSHAIVSKSKSRLARKGYLKGVVIDLLYDHFLSVSWGKYASQTLPMFLNSFYQAAEKATKTYPKKVEKTVMKLVESDRLATYIKFEGFVDVMHRIEYRLSDRIKAKDSMLNYISIVEQQYQALQTDFETFFPDLMKFFQSHELGSAKDNYLIHSLN